MCKSAAAESARAGTVTATASPAQSRRPPHRHKPQMAREEKEREVVTELLELYRDMPCLWDLTCESYKDSTQKKNAWDILATKLKDIDPMANAASAKKKIDNLRISYARESKKVKESKNRTGSSTSDVHKPSLWYYELMTFLEKKNDVKRKGIDSLMSDDEDEKQIGETKRKKLTREKNIEIKKEKLIEAANNLLTSTTESNAFGVYVGKKMEEIPLGQQRDLAEKLISEIMFLAKTNNLTFETRIQIPSRTHHSPQSYFVHSPSSISSNRYHYMQTDSNPSPPSHTPHYSPSPTIPIQSPTSPPSHTQHPSPASSHCYIISQPVNPPSPNCPLPIQSPTSPFSLTQNYSPSTTSNQNFPNSSHITHPNSSLSSQNAVDVSENAVLYAEGPAGELLKELLVFKKHK